MLLDSTVQSLNEGDDEVPVSNTDPSKTPRRSRQLGKTRHIHFVGIGGIGMSGIAEVLLNLGGYVVSGSDLKFSPVTERLVSLGAKVFEGHAAENIRGADVVVISSAVRADNPEVLEASRLQIPVIPRAEMLAELMRLKYGIAIAGTHGKTTTTSMVATVMQHSGFDPTIIVGGKLNMLGSNAKLGAGDLLVAEADESDGSFLMLSPILAVVTNIDREHLDHFKGGIEEIRQCFTAFVNRVPFYGGAILCLDDPNVQQILPDVTRRTITYAINAQADVTARQITMDQSFGSEFVVYHKYNEFGRMKLKVPGLHNVYNSLAALAVAFEFDIPFGMAAAALSEFRGADRRFQFKGEKNGITVVDDYGHHPTEVQATLAAAKTSGRRVVVMFQPHRYTRTQHLKDEFARSFYGADVVLVTDIYAASETPIQGVTSGDLVNAIKKYGHRNVSYAGSLDEATSRLKEVVQSGDLVLTLGAGNVWRCGEELLKLL
ncbi:MAG TPA: UDP-N-acetylmuramate--L-alanine ligase [Blastocatellia bacterium]|nr:UDP-N-acetylmuramate--L-alanine ligase [Blastocatellia bacterium]